MKSCIAVDVGGTKMLVAEVREDASVVNMRRYVTAGLQKQQVMQAILDNIRDYEQQVGWEKGVMPDTIGIGVNSMVDLEKGLWLPNWDYEPTIALVDEMKKAFPDCRCYIENDVKAAVMAESMFGAGKGCRDMLYLNVGTGMAAGFIVNGKIVRGSDGFAGEVGYMNLNYGEGDSAEMRASGMGLVHQAKLKIRDYPDSLLKPYVVQGVTGYQVFEAAEKGDRLANELLDQLVKISALMISNIVCVFSPEIAVVGGGLISNGKLLDRIVNAMIPKSLGHLEKGVVLTELNPDFAGLMGAAAVGLGCQKLYC